MNSATAAPWPVLSPRAAALVAALFTLAALVVNVVAHPTPLYTVETDLVGEYLPAARELLRGVLDPAHYAFKGPGYPLLVAAAAAPLGGNVDLAARLLSPLAAGLAAWLAWALTSLAVSEAAATFVLLALLVNPVFVRHAIECGTDAPALALQCATMLLVLREGGPRTRFAAGLLAAASMLTRANAVSLLPAGALVLAFAPRTARLRGLAAWAAGVALPLGAWWWCAERAGGLPLDRNHLNIAWELYGRGVPWDQFEAHIGARFHSLADVIAYDPVTAITRTAENLVRHRWLDARELLAPGLALPALPGLLLLARRPRARGWLVHGAATMLVLAPVFYNARFALPLLPLELAAAGAAFAWLAARVRAAAPRAAWAVPALLAALLGISLVRSLGDTGRALAQAPHETRLAGRWLAAHGFAGQRVMARKPHVAHFAGMAFVPLPVDVTLAALPHAARAQGAQVLFVSGIEQLMHPAFAVLGDSGVALPGFEPLAFGRLGPERAYALYRLHEPAADSAAFAAAYRAALLRHEALHPGSAVSLLFLAAQYLELGEAAEALARLDQLGARGGAPAERYRTQALLALGRLDAAARACERAMQLEPPVAWHWGRLAEIRARQGRFDDARAAFERAVALEPASLEYLLPLARVHLFQQDPAGAAAIFERCLRLAPSDPALRRAAIQAWRAAGDAGRAQRVRDDGVRAGIPATTLD